MAIGNAPWPIGVTMVGIHARTGREKINDRNVAHVLNDETQRKYIQVIIDVLCNLRLLFWPYHLYFVSNFQIIECNAMPIVNQTCTSDMCRIDQYINTHTHTQALKRLMTQCQVIYPTDPSRCVDFQPIVH